MDDWDCLENSCTLRGTVGSNPTLSDLCKIKTGKRFHLPAVYTA